MATNPASSPRRASGRIENRQLFDPVNRALDVVGERWSLAIVRHLLGGPRGFEELRSRTGATPRILSTRLRQLSERALVETVEGDTPNRSRYALTPLGRTLEPVVRELAVWWVQQMMARTGPFKETTAAAVVEALPYLLREERAAGVHLTYELRLTGTGGGVWTIDIHDGQCTVREGFAERADVRYTADARDWTRLAGGMMDDREAHRMGRLTKDGQGLSIAYFFYRPSTPKRAKSEPR